VLKGKHSSGKPRWCCYPHLSASRRAYREANKEVLSAKQKAYHAENGRAITLRKYGITQQDYDRILAEQGGGCAICGGPPRGPGAANGFFHADHCHRSNEFRGLLCGSCNTALGLLNDDPERVERAAAYLREDRPVLAGV
jgi:hypothetical protein